MIVWVCLKRGIEIQWHCQIHNDTHSDLKRREHSSGSWTLTTADTCRKDLEKILCSIQLRGYNYLLGKCNRTADKIRRPSITETFPMWKELNATFWFMMEIWFLASLWLAHLGFIQKRLSVWLHWLSDEIWIELVNNTIVFCRAAFEFILNIDQLSHIDS